MNWSEYSIEAIRDNRLLFTEFLKDYTQLTGEKVNPSCPRCLKNYYKRLTQTNMKNDCKYKLHQKRCGLPLEFGSNIFVNNDNITDIYAEKLIKRFKELQGKDFSLDYLFSEYPKAKKNDKIEVVSDSKESDNVG